MRDSRRNRVPDHPEHRGKVHRGVAVTQSITREPFGPGNAGDTRRLVKKTLVKLDADASEERRRQQHRERRAFTSSKPDGRAFLGVHGSAEDTAVAWESLTLLAKLTFGADDPRTLDQQRADLVLSLPGFALSARRGHGGSLRTFLGLPDEQNETGPCTLARRNDLTPAQQRRIQAVVLVPVQTGLGLADEPGDLVGYGPVSAGHARDLMAAAELRKACVDLDTGRLIALSDDLVRPRSGWYWTEAYPCLDLIEIDTTHPSRGNDDDGGGGDGDPPPGTPPRSPSTAAFGPPPPRPTGSPPRPPARLSPFNRCGPLSAEDAMFGTPLTLFDALLQMVHTPMPAESRVEDRHDPSPGLADLIRLRDPRCMGPGCSLPSRCCDLEHHDPWPTGTTSAANVGPASRRCHNAKTFGGWSYTPHPGAASPGPPPGAGPTASPAAPNASTCAASAPDAPAHPRTNDPSGTDADCGRCGRCFVTVRLPTGWQSRAEPCRFQASPTGEMCSSRRYLQGVDSRYDSARGHETGLVTQEWAKRAAQGAAARASTPRPYRPRCLGAGERNERRPGAADGEALVLPGGVSCGHGSAGCPHGRRPPTDPARGLRLPPRSLRTSSHQGRPGPSRRGPRCGGCSPRTCLVLAAPPPVAGRDRP